MKKITAAAALILGVIASGQAMAAPSSVDLTVTGKLLPSACTLSTSGATLDLGDIDYNKLKLAEPTVMTDNAKEMNIMVNCPSETYTGIKVSDMLSTDKFKLGNAGTFELKLDVPNSKIDGKSAGGSIVRNGETGGFSTPAGTEPLILNAKGQPNAGIDLTNDGSDRVKAKIKIYHVIVTPTIKASKDLDTSQQQDIAGAATIDLFYI